MAMALALALALALSVLALLTSLHGTQLNYSLLKVGASMYVQLYMYVS